MNLLITGATGQLGSKIVNHVLNLKHDETIYVSVRDAAKAESLKDKGIIVRTGDFDDSQSLGNAFAGIDRMVLVSTDGDTPTRIRQHKNAIDAAKEAEIKEIVYTSLSKADNSPLNLAEVHKATEAYLIDSGINYKILRNNWYLENELNTIESALQSGVITTTYGDGKVGWLTRDEYALAAASALLDTTETNRIYTLSNQPATIHEFASVLSDLAHKEITVNVIDDATYHEALVGMDMPAGVADFVVAINRGIREGGLDAPSQDYQLLTKQAPQTLRESLKAYIK